MNDSTLFDPETPDEVIREAMAGTANRVVAAYMRMAQNASTAQEKEEAKARMKEYWAIKNDLDMSRQEMTETIVRMWEMLAEMEEV
ncbi:hypothetical protein ACOQFV_06495 [Nocardiopsis changdeensis]|uniref:Uncharacterized protein n=1 Tax=Nocardiopsis changdeensis TaxID=2831969 RepID=A0ABX8BN40_9ACTN|nr:MULTISPECIES: hypothetical protein [Nocardiopsis]QUX23499.1 hypothetical protein KGD84_03730 [Nocardiopsis changdeensis]QYX39443.1 hypothetical protein K1J57_13185 [Nocardiopsis sp. MT53]